MVLVPRKHWRLGFGVIWIAGLLGNSYALLEHDSEGWDF